MKINFCAAQLLLSEGKTVVSDVSKTAYDLKSDGQLYAEGLEVSSGYVTDEEKRGLWYEVHPISTRAEFEKLSSEEVESLLDDAFVKFKFDQQKRNKQ